DEAGAGQQGRGRTLRPAPAGGRLPRPGAGAQPRGVSGAVLLRRLLGDRFDRGPRLLVRRDPPDRGRLRHARTRLQRDGPQCAACGQARRSGLIQRVGRDAVGLQQRGAIVAAPPKGESAMAGATPLFPLRAALLSSALVGLLGACAPDREAADAPPMPDQAGGTTATAQPAGYAMSTPPGTAAGVPAALCNAVGVHTVVGQSSTGPV